VWFGGREGRSRSEWQTKTKSKSVQQFQMGFAVAVLKIKMNIKKNTPSSKRSELLIHHRNNKNLKENFFFSAW
jgi:hypothetical protein